MTNSLTRSFKEQKISSGEYRQVLCLPKLPGFFYLLGGALLFASLFLPAVKRPDTGELLYPIMIWKYSFPGTPLGIFLLKVTLPIFYLFGLTTFTLGLTGSFTKKGISRVTIFVHIFEVILLLLGTGIFFIAAVIAIEDITFGIFLSGFGMIGWIVLTAAFVYYTITAENIIERLNLTTTIGSLLTFLVMVIITLDTLYYKNRRVHYGLLLSLAGCISTYLGGYFMKKYLKRYSR